MYKGQQHPATPYTGTTMHGGEEEGGSPEIDGKEVKRASIVGRPRPGEATRVDGVRRWGSKNADGEKIPVGDGLGLGTAPPPVRRDRHEVVSELPAEEVDKWRRYEIAAQRPR